MQRIVFVNLHGNEFLLKTLNKIIFKQSVATKHKYLLDYLLSSDDYEVCTYINNKGFSMSYSHARIVPQWIVKIEHKYCLKKNNIPFKKITVLTQEEEIREDDILIIYNYYRNQYEFISRPNCLVVVSMIHFGIFQSDVCQKINPDVMYNEATFQHGSKIYDKYYGWYNKHFLAIPFVYGERFKVVKPFAKRKNQAVSVGTITYMTSIKPIYGSSVCQPARKQVKDHAIELKPWIDCYNSDYLEDTNDKKLKGSSIFARIYNNVYSKFYSGRQKKYYSFNMVEKFNDYKMCVVGEEIMGIPGVGFVEGMACGCAYIGQTIGYYEDYGMQEGVHYIGYDGTLEDLKSKIAYYQMQEHQEELERIAKAGCDFVRKNFCGPVIAKELIENLVSIKRSYNG